MKEPGRLTVHGVTKSQTRLSDFTFFHFLVQQTASGNLLCDNREFSPVLSDGPGGWDGVGDGREVRGEGGIPIPVADSC